MWVLCCVHCAEKAKTPYLNEKWGFKWFASACPARPRHENIFKIFEILEIIEIHFRPKTSLPVLSFDFVFVFHPCLDLRRLPLQGSISGLRGHLQTGVWVSFPPLQRPGSLCHSPGQVLSPASSTAFPSSFYSPQHCVAFFMPIPRWLSRGSSLNILWLLYCFLLFSLQCNIMVVTFQQRPVPAGQVSVQIFSAFLIQYLIIKWLIIKCFWSHFGVRLPQK